MVCKREYNCVVICVYMSALWWTASLCRGFRSSPLWPSSRQTVIDEERTNKWINSIWRWIYIILTQPYSSLFPTQCYYCLHSSFVRPESTAYWNWSSINILIDWCSSFSASMGLVWLLGTALQVQSAPQGSLCCLTRIVLDSSGWSWSLSVFTVAWQTIWPMLMPQMWSDLRPCCATCSHGHLDALHWNSSHTHYIPITSVLFLLQKLTILNSSGCTCFTNPLGFIV